jgi:hypothetical protein
MPDIPNRRTHEADLAAGLYDAFVANSGPPPNFAAIEAATREKTAASLVVIYLLMLGNLDEEHEIGVGIAERQAMAAAYADARATEVASKLTDNMRVEIDALTDARGRGELSPAEFERRAVNVFSRGRAETLATTEVTRAASAGESAAVEVARAKGNGLIAVWQTERDASVCPICKPLDQEPVEVWEKEHPSGPPAHPNCRCFLTWVPETELTVRK